MESVLRHVLKHFLDTYISGLDNIDCSTLEGVTLRDLKLKDERIAQGNEGQEDSPLQLVAGSVGMLQLKALELGKLQIVASEVVFDFSFSPMKALQQAVVSSSAPPPSQFAPEAVPCGPVPSAFMALSSGSAFAGRRIMNPLATEDGWVPDSLEWVPDSVECLSEAAEEEEPSSPFSPRAVVPVPPAAQWHHRRAPATVRPDDAVSASSLRSGAPTPRRGQVRRGDEAHEGGLAPGAAVLHDKAHLVPADIPWHTDFNVDALVHPRRTLGI